jgi:kynureninase
MTTTWRTSAMALDAQDPLASFKEAFDLPQGVIYLNGNSLGPLPRAACERAEQVIRQEWGQGLVRSWNSAGWFDAPLRLGRMLAGLLGVDPDETLVADATGINLYKAAAAALALRPGRRTVVMEGSNFPTNNYVVQGLLESLGGGYRLHFAEKDELADAIDAIDADVAAIILTHVHYKTGHRLDMAGLTKKAHAAGALAIWDLCHSAGVIPVALNAVGVDFAVGCTYKYLNGGPGSPAFIFAARRHHAAMRQPLSGWWGHAMPFAFERDFRLAEGIARMQTGTQPMLSLLAAEAGITLALQADPRLAAAKAGALGDLFIEGMDGLAADHGFALISPRLAQERGGHVAYGHPHGYAIMKALIARGVIGDFRAPDVLRFGFSPLYLSYGDVVSAVHRIAETMQRQEWRNPAFQAQDKVT